MIMFKVFATASLLCVLVAGGLDPRYAESGRSPIFPRDMPPANSSEHFSALQDAHKPYRKGKSTVKEQNNDTCVTKGERHWTGTIDVSDQRRLFFWFFNSRDDPDNDPIIIWINGGPGAASVFTLLAEVGPCMVTEDGNGVVLNEWAWNEKASLLFIDQPAGVGFSTFAPNSAMPSSDEDGSEDFESFLKIFFRDLFPSIRHVPIHMASISYGGHFVPTYMKYIMETREHRPKEAFNGNITSLILMNGFFDAGAAGLGSYELLCTKQSKFKTSDESFCPSLRQKFSECYRWRQQCLSSSIDDVVSCAVMATVCLEMEKLYEELGFGQSSLYNSKGIPLVHVPRVTCTHRWR
jgi:cathepsin A (carboxypeptidase C)